MAALVDRTTGSDRSSHLPAAAFEASRYSAMSQSRPQSSNGGESSAARPATSSSSQQLESTEDVAARQEPSQPWATPSVSTPQHRASTPTLSSLSQQQQQQQPHQISSQAASSLPTTQHLSNYPRLHPQSLYNSIAPASGSNANTAFPSQQELPSSSSGPHMGGGSSWQSHQLGGSGGSQTYPSHQSGFWSRSGGAGSLPHLQPPYHTGSAGSGSGSTEPSRPVSSEGFAYPDGTSYAPIHTSAGYQHHGYSRPIPTSVAYGYQGQQYLPVSGGGGMSSGHMLERINDGYEDSGAPGVSGMVASSAPAGFDYAMSSSGGGGGSLGPDPRYSLGSFMDGGAGGSSNSYERDMYDARRSQSGGPDPRHPYYSSFEVKHRRRTTKSQFKILEDTFVRTPKPTAEVRKAISETLDMPARAVQIWFQNRRAKAKQANKRASVAHAAAVAAGKARPPPPKSEDADSSRDSSMSSSSGRRGADHQPGSPHSSELSLRSGSTIAGPSGSGSGGAASYAHHHMSGAGGGYHTYHAVDAQSGLTYDPVRRTEGFTNTGQHYGYYGQGGQGGGFNESTVPLGPSQPHHWQPASSLYANYPASAPAAPARGGSSSFDGATDYRPVVAGRPYYGSLVDGQGGEQGRAAAVSSSSAGSHHGSMVQQQQQQSYYPSQSHGHDTSR